jgi:hypothetical protein
VFNTALRYIFWRSRDRTLETNGLTATGETFSLESSADRETAFTAILHHCTDRRLSGEDKDGIVAEAAARLHFDYDDLVRRRLLYLAVAR